MILVRAPLRIPLGGGGTDLPSYYEKNGGFILSAAINKYVYLYVNRPAADNLLRLKYSKYEQVNSAAEIQHDLVRPALQYFDLDNNLEIVSMADVPDGTGMGSSGSYLVALLMALSELKKERMPTQELAEKACDIEMNMAGHPVGKHDHYIAAFGGFTCLEIDKSGVVDVDALDISISTVEALRNNLLLFYTGINRSSRGVLAEQKQDTEDGNKVVVDSLDFTKQLGYRIKKALETGEVDLFGNLLHEHWENKKRRSGKISNPSIDRWYEISRENGALGGKVIGAGGGGFLMLYCPAQEKSDVRNSLISEGLQEMAFDFDDEGTKVMVNF